MYGAILTHFNPHFDELLAFIELVTEGEERFPGVSKIRTLDVTGDPNYGGDEVAQCGILTLGLGGGQFDEHVLGKNGKCAASLVAEHLGICDDPAWRRLLAFALVNDTQGKGTTFDIAYLPRILYGTVSHNAVVKWATVAINAICHHEANGGEYNPRAAALVFDRIFAAWLEKKFGDEILDGELANFVFGPTEKRAELLIKGMNVANDRGMEMLLKFFRSESGQDDIFNIRGVPWLIYVQNPVNALIAIKWAFTAFDAKYDEQVRFITETVREYKKKAKSMWIGPSGKSMEVMVIDWSDNTQVAKYARSKGAAVVVQRTTKGNIQVYTNSKFRLDICDFVGMWRLAEQAAVGAVVVRPWEELRGEGYLLPEVSSLYYQKAGEMALNGSSSIVQPPTRVNLSWILWALEVALFPDERFPLECSQGTRYTECAWYKDLTRRYGEKR